MSTCRSNDTVSPSKCSDDSDVDRLKNYSRSLAPYSFEPSDCDGDSASSSCLPSAIMIQKMAGCLICFGKFAPFESTDIQ